MAVSYIAARPINLAGTQYNAGDPVTTTGWNPNVLSTMIRMGWIDTQSTSAGQLHTAGTLANLPANGSQPDGSTYLATDQNGGTPYLMVAGTWVQESAGVSQATGMIAGPAQLGAAFDVKAVGIVPTDVTGMSINVPFSTHGVLLKGKFELQANSGTAAAASNLRMQLLLTDNANNILDAATQTFVQVSAVAVVFTAQLQLEKYLPANTPAATYKIRATLLSAAPANWTSAFLLPGNGAAVGINDNFYALAG